MPGGIKNISVLMPVYNTAGYTAYAVKSILNQTFKEIELIIIDDGSTDNSEEVIKSISDSRVRYYKTEHRGTPYALNYGAGYCSFDWIARIDSDDLNTVQRLQKQAEFLEQNSDIDILSCWSVYFSDPEKILFSLESPEEHDDIYDFLDLHNPLNQSGVMLRKSILKDNPFNELFAGYEDFELYHRIRDKVRFANLPEYLVYTRMRKGSRSASADTSQIKNILFNTAFGKMIDAKSKGEHFYWATKIAWINYFYGERKESRSYFKNSFSYKNLAAYFTTFLPDEYFHKFIKYRFRYRMKSLLKGKKLFKKELRKLIS
jgi:glycosyltransferase involved in cell wall biosynthesis